MGLDFDNKIPPPIPEVTGLRSGQYMTSEDPRAIRMAAAKDERTGEVYTGAYHGAALEKYVRAKYPKLNADEVTGRAWGLLG